ncbi:MAG: diphosphate--fructose-6-phosphate 1-phosphotransferase [bacterium]|nr:diphosphate--fructose-6-phosphate 1-phosphotransferase [bacterium]
MSKLQGKAVIAQGGGPTAVINQSLVGAALECRKFNEVTHVYGARHGVSGIVKEDFVDLSQATSHNLEQVACTPSSALGSTRDKPDIEYCKKIFDVFKKYDIRYFFYIGGNDSSDTCRLVNQFADEANYECRCVHIPKTIDNDLVVTDHCPGFGSAARYVALAMAGANLDNSALPGVYIAVVMGRHAGFLTGAAAAYRRYPDDGPHLVYVPERQFNRDKFLADVDATYKKYGRCIIAASEGIWESKDENGKHVPLVVSITGSAEKDAHGNIQLSGTGALGDVLSNLIKDKLGIKRVRADTLGYLQRSFLGVVSPVDQHEAREVGEKAVQYALWHNVDGSVVIKRVGDYAVEYDLVKLDEIAAKTKYMPDEFINAEGNNVTDAFRHYVLPLMGDAPVANRLFAPPAPKA